MGNNDSLRITGECFLNLRSFEKLHCYAKSMFVYWKIGQEDGNENRPKFSFAPSFMQYIIT